MQDQEPLLFPSIEVAGRKEAREIKVGVGREHLYIRFENIRMKEGSNWRRPAPYQTHEEWLKELNIEALADEIYANSGPSDAIEGDVEKGTGLFYPTDGQRRWMAIGMLLERGETHYPNGEEIGLVEVLRNPLVFTDAQRMRKNYASQNKLPLKLSEIARGLLQYKISVKGEDDKEKSNAQIALDYGVSRQYVDNMIKINSLTPDILKALDKGEISQNQALLTLKPKKEEVYTGTTSLKEHGNGVIEIEASEIDAFFEEISDKPMERFPVDDEQPEETETFDVSKPAKPVKVETQAAIDIEEEYRRTPTKIAEQVNTERKEEREAMLSIDYRPDKIQGEFLINESVANLDRMLKTIKHLPEGLKQHKDDLTRLAEYNIKKLEDLRDILKKAADQR